MDKRNKIQKLWFGIEEVTMPCIVSPVPGIYKELLREYKPNQKLQGWYAPSIISLGSTDYLVMQIPMGGASEDIAKVIGPSNPTYMMGYCGGLSPDFQIGDIVQDIDNSVNISCFKEGRIQTVDGLLDKRYSECSDLVDMENDFYKKHLENYSSYFIVSDLPLSRPFFDITQLDKKRIKQSQTKLIKLLGEKI